MIGCLRTRVCKQPITALYFEFEIELKFYNLEACMLVQNINLVQILVQSVIAKSFHLSQQGQLT